MTDDDLLAVLERGGEVPVPYFGDARIPVSACELPREEALGAFKQFLSLTDAQRRLDGRHLFAYYMETVDTIGAEEILEAMNGVTPSVDQIWNHTKPKHIFFSALDAGKYASKRTIYVQCESEVDWEPEHGLQMSWADGSRLTKVSAFDGHPTNGHAFADPERDEHVFTSSIRELCTLPDPLV